MSDIISGRNPIVEALKAGRPINKILLDKNITRHSVIAEILNQAKERSIPVEYVERQIIEKQVPVVNQGIIAYAAAKEYVSLDDLVAISSKKNELAFYVILDGIEDPQNLGAILRTAEATGIHGVIIRERREVGLTAAVARASAGAIEYVPVARVTNIAQTIEELKKNNIWVIGIDMNAETDYHRVDYKVATAIVIGGEGGGLSTLVRKRCDVVVSIPMKGKISSLNASVAAALVMYEAYRQRELMFSPNEV
jgi:23S rRNA (guanosine2251-2'-O)-methyltransferase